MKQDYDLSEHYVLQHEGGYTNDPHDPGGPTNFGITIYDYRRYVMPSATAQDVRNMKLSEAQLIYRLKYWAVMKCDQLPFGLDYAVFDYGVNSGVGRPPRVLRRILGLPDSIYAFDDVLIAQLFKHDRLELIQELCEERLNFLQHLRTWPNFGKGWSHRVYDVEMHAKSMQLVQGPPLVPAQGRGYDPDEHARVRAMQTMLAKAGFDPGAIDGDLGPKTILAFQRYEHIKVDGVVGEVTRPLLDKCLAEIPPLVETHT